MNDNKRRSPATPSNLVSVAAGWWDDMRSCLAFLSRLPVNAPDTSSFPEAMRAFPFAGAVIGLFGGVVCAGAISLGVPALVAACLAVSTLVLMTGALHEDALSDVADGFGGGGTKERKLEIMHDSRCGAFGVAALILLLVTKIASVSALAGGLPAPWLIVPVYAGAAAWSRTLAISVMASTPPARSDGLATSVGAPGVETHRQVLICGALLTLLLVWLAMGPLACFAAFAVSVAVFWLVRQLALAQIGGHTGDVAGTVQALSELAFLATLTVFV
ncbi:MAG: adenosylcobinamide-GDP ribazoletransferase [Hyphomicrobiales bacterium]